MMYNFQTRCFDNVTFSVNGITVFGTVDDTGVLWIGHDDNNHRYVIRNTGDAPKVVIDGKFAPSAKIVFNAKVVEIIRSGYLDI